MAVRIDKLFIDTNILIYATLIGSPFHITAWQKLQDFQNAQTQLWVNRQVIREYLSTISKLSTSNPRVVASVHLADLQVLLEDFTIADENEFTTRELFYILEQVAYGRKQVHDSNIVATMMANNIQYILTHNVDDFTRFGDFIQLEPLI
jgi:predicted nucleic acid-binding protein